MEPRACVAALGGRQAHGLHADRRHRQLPHRHGARSRHSRREGPRHLPVHGRQLRQQEPESGCRSDRRDAGQAGRRAGEARALAQGRLHRRARPLADDAVLQGRRRATTARCRRSSCAATAAWARIARTPAPSAASSCISARTSRASIYPGLHQQDGLGKLPRTRVSAGLLRHPVDDGRRRVQAEDGSGRVRR